MAEPLRFIVAEVSKNWQDGRPVTYQQTIGELFEMVLETNRRRGYRLHSFTLHQLMTGPETMTETVLAVFELVDHKEAR